jgi:hypothetical protein
MILSVSFAGGYNLVSDNNAANTLSAPHWLKLEDGTLLRQYPYLYASGFTLKLASAKLKFDKALPDSASVYIRATTNVGITFDAQIASTIEPDKKTVLVSDFTANWKDLGPTTLFLNNLVIAFEVSVTGLDGPFSDAGESANPVYVCLASGPPANVTLFQTTVHLACSKDGASDADQAFNNTWDLMSGLIVCRWSAISQGFYQPLYYYRSGTTFGENSPFRFPSQLLSNAPNYTGQCQAWARLMQDAVAINGANAILMMATVLNTFPYQGFLVKNWSFSPDGGPQWVAIFSAKECEMQPPPDPNAPRVYGQITNLAGLPGQNGEPSEKVFSNHVFLEYTTTGDPPGITRYYDPSYGAVYLDPHDFQTKAVDGLVIYVDPQLTAIIEKPDDLVTYFKFSIPP